MEEEGIVQQILDELVSSFEPLDTRTAALLQFLKAKGIVTDEEFAPFLEQAGNASNVRWRAARLRIGSLISTAMKTAGRETTKAETNTTPRTADSAPETSKETAQDKPSGEESQPTRPSDDNSNPEKRSPSVAEKHESRKQSQPIKSRPSAKGETRAAEDTSSKGTKEGTKQNAA
jgi:hypothetical protein